MVTECDMDSCRLNTFMVTRKMSTMLVNTGFTNDITVPDLESLRDKLDVLEISCALKQKDREDIDNMYRDLSSTFPQSGPNLASSIVKLMDKINFSNSECKCYK